MRRPRCLRRGQTTAYHCMSRVVGGQHLLQDHERAVLREMTIRLAAFLQILLINYTILSSHFHLLPRVPGKVKIKNRKLLKLLREFYGPEHPKTREFQQALGNPKGSKLKLLRKQYLARMGDLSIFLKELKESFSKWYNEQNNRFGAFWAERFKSVILADGWETWQAVSAYIDLNGVRSGQTNDPAKYRYCGFAEALARDGPARQGLASFLPGKDWEEQLAHYRMVLYGKGAAQKNAQQGVVDPEKAREVFRAGGKLSLSEALLLKVRYFSEGLAVGTEQFVNQIFKQCRKKYCKKRTQGAWPMKGADWGGLMSLKKIKDPIDLPAQGP